MTKRLRDSTGPILLAGLLLLSLPNHVPASQELAGGYLQTMTGAKAQGMANAATADPDLNFSLFSNPAGLIQFNQPILSLDHQVLTGDVLLEHMAFALPLSKHDYIGLGAAYFDAGAFTGYTQDRQTVSYTHADRKWMVKAAYARIITKQLFLGGVVNGIQHDLFDHAGFGISADVGALYLVMQPLTLGLTVTNALPATIHHETYLPALTLGLSSRWFKSRLKVNVDGRYTLNSHKIQANGGLEWQVLPKAFLLSIGLNDELVPSFGLTMKHRGLLFSYAGVFEALGIRHHLGMTVAWKTLLTGRKN